MIQIAFATNLKTYRGRRTGIILFVSCFETSICIGKCSKLAPGTFYIHKYKNWGITAWYQVKDSQCLVIKQITFNFLEIFRLSKGDVREGVESDLTMRFLNRRAIMLLLSENPDLPQQRRYGTVASLETSQPMLWDQVKDPTYRLGPYSNLLMNIVRCWHFFFTNKSPTGFNQIKT